MSVGKGRGAYAVWCIPFRQAGFASKGRLAWGRSEGVIENVEIGAGAYWRFWIKMKESTIEAVD